MWNYPASTVVEEGCDGLQLNPSTEFGYADDVPCWMSPRRTIGRGWCLAVGQCSTLRDPEWGIHDQLHAAGGVQGSCRDCGAYAHLRHGVSFHRNPLTSPPPPDDADDADDATFGTDLKPVITWSYHARHVISWTAPPGHPSIPLGHWREVVGCVSGSLDSQSCCCSPESSKAHPANRFATAQIVKHSVWYTTCLLHCTGTEVNQEP